MKDKSRIFERAFVIHNIAHDSDQLFPWSVPEFRSCNVLILT